MTAAPASSPLPQVETVLEERDLLMRWLPGTSRRLVVVFTGVRAGFGGQPVDEFARSASADGGNNVLFVTDRLGSWYAAAGLWRRIVRLIRYLRRSERIEEIVTLGNSMGGYGALLLPRDLRVMRAIAFSPQIAMDRSILDDARWPDIASLHGPLPAGDVAESFAGTRTHYYLTAGGACEEDLAHLARVPDLRRVHRWVLPGGRHNVAAGLRDAGLLTQVIEAILRGRKTRVERLYARYSGLAA